MFQFSMIAVMMIKAIGQISSDPPFGGQLLQTVLRPLHPQIGIASACDQLLCLGEKLDLSYAAQSQFNIVT